VDAVRADAPAEVSPPVVVEGACGPNGLTRPLLYDVKNATTHGHAMQETTDINLATFIKVVKSVPIAGTHFNGHQLCISFNISAEDLKTYEQAYLNSPYADYDATKRNLVRMLKRVK
jgi:hypothetical protein